MCQHLTPITFVWVWAEEANRKLGSALTELKVPNQHGKIVNVVYVDYVEYARATDVCLYLNGEHP